MDCTASPHLDSGHVDLEQEADSLLQPRLVADARHTPLAASCNSASPANVHIFTPNIDYDDKLTQKFSCTNNCLNGGGAAGPPLHQSQVSILYN